MTRKPPVLDRVNQPILQRLASTHTKPKPSTRYIDPPDVKELYRTAKRTKREQDWKIAHKARRAAQERWRVQRHEKAAEGQWQSFRYLKSQGGTEWTVHYVDMAEHEKQEPQRWTVEHFRKLFQCTEPRDPPRWDKAVDTGHCHVARAANRSKPPASSYMDSYRTLAWWKEQQRNGLTHPASFYPYHTREETALNNASQHHDWRQRAQDPAAWLQHMPRWISDMDVAWASGRQLALPS